MLVSLSRQFCKAVNGVIGVPDCWGECLYLESYMYDHALLWDKTRLFSNFRYKWIVPFTFCTATSNCSSVDTEKDIVWLNKSNGK